MMDTAERDKEIMNAVSVVVNGWSLAGIIALKRQIILSAPWMSNSLIELEWEYRKELKRPELKQFQA